jgi:soluble lytic murein transglycosylase-like protein
MGRLELIALARQMAAKYALDGDLVCAMVEQESQWDPWAIRFEPGFLAKYIQPIEDKAKIRPTEAYARSFSWGLLQVMGEDAREDGFAGRSLAELCDPATGLEAGCKRFARIVKRVGAVPDAQSAALLHYNGGKDPNYPGQVLARLPAYNA